MKKDFDYSKTIPVEIELNGKKFNGKYFVSRQIITVMYDFKEISTQMGGSDPERLSKIILREMVDK